jgi:hypothetical protein
MDIKPIHKFNGGIGATLCHKCNVIIHTGFTEDLFCEEHGGKPKFAYKIVREDGLTKYGNNLKWIEWNENDTFKQTHDDIGIGRGLIVDFFMGNFEWMTTQVQSYTKDDNIITFNTKNSTYKIYALAKK